jgi:DNA-binding NarL/FixJ family response regulator
VKRDSPVTVVLADDQPLIRSALAALVATDPGLRVVGEAADGPGAVELVRRKQPDVAVLDIRMPRMSGIEATAHIRRDHPRTAVIVLTTYDLDEHVHAAIRAGACGFFLKDGDAEDLLRGIHAAAAGEAVMDAGVLKRLLDELAGAPGPDPAALRALDALSERERQVLALVADGLTNDQVADRLVIGTATVKSHVSAILTKLGVRDRTQAVVLAYRAGLADPGR